MKKIYQEMEVVISTFQEQDAIMASDGGTAGDLVWLSHEQEVV